MGDGTADWLCDNGDGLENPIPNALVEAANEVRVPGGGRTVFLLELLHVCYTTIKTQRTYDLADGGTGEIICSCI